MSIRQVADIVETRMTGLTGNFDKVPDFNGLQVRSTYMSWKFKVKAKVKSGLILFSFRGVGLSNSMLARESDTFTTSALFSALWPYNLSDDLIKVHNISCDTFYWYALYFSIGQLQLIFLPFFLLYSQQFWSTAIRLWTWIICLSD